MNNYKIIIPLVAFSGILVNALLDHYNIFTNTQSLIYNCVLLLLIVLLFFIFFKDKWRTREFKEILIKLTIGIVLAISVHLYFVFT